MIEVIPIATSSEAQTRSDSGTSQDNVELLAAAADFFADRLLTRRQQKRLGFFIEFTAQPVRGPISLDMLAGKSGLFGFCPPRLFEMTVSSAAGTRAALDAVAVEMTRIAQVMSQRLEIFAKKRKIGGQRDTELQARWLGKRAIFLDALPRAERPWVIEADATSKQLVGEFLAWSSGRIRSAPRQRPKGEKIGLYRVRPIKTKIPASSQIWSDTEKAAVMVRSSSGAESHFAEPNQIVKSPQNFSPDTVPANFVPVGAASGISRAPLDEQANHASETVAGRQTKTRVQQIVPPPARQKIIAAGSIDALQMAEFSIFVEVSSLGTTRRLNSGVFHAKVIDLLERGLISRESARAAMRFVDEPRRHFR